MTPADTALSLLRESRDGALVWHDNGATVLRLAQTAGVRVTYVHVDLTQLATEYRTVGGDAANMPRNGAESGVGGAENIAR